MKKIYLLITVNDDRVEVLLMNILHTNTKVGKSEHYDFYIHSHVLEHVWNPKEFIECIEIEYKYRLLSLFYCT